MEYSEELWKMKHFLINLCDLEMIFEMRIPLHIKVYVWFYVE